MFRGNDITGNVHSVQYNQRIHGTRKGYLFLVTQSYFNQSPIGAFPMYPGLLQSKDMLLGSVVIGGI